jgi:hypothetical protein
MAVPVFHVNASTLGTQVPIKSRSLHRSPFK